MIWTCKLTLTSLSLAVATTLLYSAVAIAGDDEFIREFHGIAGLGAGAEPKYLGSKDTKGQVFPVGQVTYDRYFIGGPVGLGVGAYLYKDDRFEFGVGLSQQLGTQRKESDDAHLKGLGDIKATQRFAVFGAYKYAWLTVKTSLLSDIGGKHQGLQATIGAEAKYRPIPRLQLTAGPKVTYGNTQYMKTFYGVTPQQSVNSGLAEFAPKSGVTSTALELGAVYQIDKSWLIGSRASFGHLGGDSGKSPITEKKAVNFAGVYFAYKF